MSLENAKVFYKRLVTNDILCEPILESNSSNGELRELDEKELKAVFGGEQRDGSDPIFPMAIVDLPVWKKPTQPQSPFPGKPIPYVM